MVKVMDIISELEKWANPKLQEDYDNSGLQVGSPIMPVSGVLFTLDCTEEVIAEAVSKNCNMIVAHHPVIFKPLKKLTGSHYTERIIIQCIHNNIALYAIHTNLDNVHTGVNKRIAERLGLINTRVLVSRKNTLEKLVFFVPVNDTEKVLYEVFQAGAGGIGNYSECSFRVEGRGTFKPNEQANPVIGERYRLEEVNENRVEVIYPFYSRNKIISALKNAHPYEEVAYYIQGIENDNQEVGSGMIGELEKDMDDMEFLKFLKERMNLELIRYTYADVKCIRKVALCGGSGSFLLSAAIRAGAHAYISADFKYHEFFEADEMIMIADIGHYESEIFTKELLYESINRKFTNIATYLSEVNSNPINYFK
jgi:dinuclear metal center YbgI/SA1388 family protein